MDLVTFAGVALGAERGLVERGQEHARFRERVNVLEEKTLLRKCAGWIPYFAWALDRSPEPYSSVSLIIRSASGGLGQIEIR
ncbi:hypothetical protein GCM10022226_79220 [Sphaerisporangium flaviroseum]|uniref:Uncharacterized protein n=1 Tax=Sphaerisporangium flaviroseum TaxID=509199 RepID=A0ABP7JH25_9ACTN